MNDEPIRNHSYLDNNFIVAEIDDEVCSSSGEMKCSYYIWDDMNNLITYENKDNATIYSYLGFVDNKIYFKTDKGIYYIEV